MQRQKEIEHAVESTLEPDVADGIITSVFKENQWGNVFYYMCKLQMGSPEAVDFNNLLLSLRSLDTKSQESPLHADAFLENDIFGWVFREAFGRADFDGSGIMSSTAELRTLAEYIIHVGRLKITSKQIDSALKTLKAKGSIVEHGMDAHASMEWFKAELTVLHKISAIEALGINITMPNDSDSKTLEPNPIFSDDLVRPDEPKHNELNDLVRPDEPKRDELNPEDADWFLGMPKPEDAKSEDLHHAEPTQADELSGSSEDLEMRKSLFARYDLDSSGEINTGQELQQLFVALFFAVQRKGDKCPERSKLE